MQGKPEAATAGKRAMLFIWITLFMDILGSTVLMPVMAYIVRPYSTDALAVSMLTVIYAAAQFLAAPVLGRLSDRAGRRPVLLLSVLGSAIGYYIFGLGGALWVLFLSRLIDGITGGNLSVAMAYIADITVPEQRAKNYALVGVAFGLGFTLGPAIGGALSQVSITAPAFAAGTLSLLSVIFGFFSLPESLPANRRSQGAFRWAEANPVAAIVETARWPGLAALLAAFFVFNVAFAGMTNNISVLLIGRFAAAPLSVATIFMAGGLMNMIVQGGAVRALVPRLGEKRLALIGLAIQVVAFVCIALAPSLWLMYPICMLSFVGNALVLPTLNALVANSVSARQQGQVAGVTASLSSVTSVAGPLLAGAAYDYLAPGAPYLGGAVLLALACVLVFRLRQVAESRQDEMAYGENPA